jgi:hypothetical protein
MACLHRVPKVHAGFAVFSRRASVTPEERQRSTDAAAMLSFLHETGPAGSRGYLATLGFARSKSISAFRRLALTLSNEACVPWPALTLPSATFSYCCSVSTMFL